MSRSLRSKTLISLAAASALFLATAGGVFAKCEHDPGACQGVTATFDGGSGSLSAGTSETVGVWILEDELPYAADGVELVFSRVATSSLIRVDANPATPHGRWEATVELPAGGTWVVSAVVRGPQYTGSFGLDTIRVEPPAAPPSTAAEPTAAPSPVLLTMLGIALTAVALASLVGIRVVGRRRTAAAQG